MQFSRAVWESAIGFHHLGVCKFLSYENSLLWFGSDMTICSAGMGSWGVKSMADNMGLNGINANW